MSHLKPRSIWLAGHARIWILAVAWAIPMFLIIFSSYGVRSAQDALVFAVICAGGGWLFAYLWWLFIDKVVRSRLEQYLHKSANNPGPRQ